MMNCEIRYVDTRFHWPGECTNELEMLPAAVGAMLARNRLLLMTARQGALPALMIVGKGDRPCRSSSCACCSHCLRQRRYLRRMAQRRINPVGARSTSASPG